MVERIQRDAVERLDDLSERTSSLRDEMSARASQLHADSEAMQVTLGISLSLSLTPTLALALTLSPEPKPSLSLALARALALTP